MPRLQEIYERYQDQGLQMVAVNVIPDQDNMIPDWIEKGNYTFTVLVGARTQKIAQDYSITGTPVTFLLDGEGKVLARYEGYQPGAEKEIEQDLREALEMG